MRSFFCCIHIMLAGRVRVGDVITHVGAVDVQSSSVDVARELLDKAST